MGKFFLKNFFTQVVYVPNDQRVMGIILRYVCWGTHQPLPGSPAPDQPTHLPPPLQTPKSFRTQLGSRIRKGRPLAYNQHPVPCERRVRTLEGADVSAARSANCSFSSPNSFYGSRKSSSLKNSFSGCPNTMFSALGRQTSRFMPQFFDFDRCVGTRPCGCAEQWQGS